MSAVRNDIDRLIDDKEAAKRTTIVEPNVTAEKKFQKLAAGFVS
jgi:hypothetical protein